MSLIYKPFYWAYLATSGAWYWTRRRFTLAGLWVAAGVVVTAATGVDIENTVSYQSFVLLLGFLTFAFVSSFFFRAKFSATRLLPRVGGVNFSITTLIAPVSAIVLGVLVLGEQLTPLELLGVAGIFLGLIVMDGRLVRRFLPKRAVAS